MRFTLKTVESLIKEALKEEPTGDAWLDARYDEQTANPAIRHSQPYYRLFYLLAQKLKPKTVIELGGWQGTGAGHFAAGWPDATVISIDHHKDPGDAFNRMKMLDVVNRYGVKYLQGWTAPGYAEEYPEKGAVSVFEDVKQIIGSDGIDILFIDSWHEGRYFKRDWDYYSPLLSSPALVICDDVFDNHIFVDQIATFEALPGEKLTNAQVHPGIPMGFIKYEIKRTTTARKPRQKRTATKKAA